MINASRFTGRKGKCTDNCRLEWIQSKLDLLNKHRNELYNFNVIHFDFDRLTKRNVFYLRLYNEESILLD